AAVEAGAAHAGRDEGGIVDSAQFIGSGAFVFVPFNHQGKPLNGRCGQYIGDMSDSLNSNALRKIGLFRVLSEFRGLKNRCPQNTRITRKITSRNLMWEKIGSHKTEGKRLIFENQ